MPHPNSNDAFRLRTDIPIAVVTTIRNDIVECAVWMGDEFLATRSTPVFGDPEKCATALHYELVQQITGMGETEKKPQEEQHEANP